MLKLLCFISLAVVSVSASLPAGPCRIMNNNGNVLKLDMSGLQVVGGSNSESVQLWQLIQPVPMDPNVYAIMPVTAGPTGNLMTFDTGNRDTPQNGDNAVVQPGNVVEPKFQWTINPTDNTNSNYTITRINPGPGGNFNVDLAYGSKEEGAKVQAYESAPKDVNQWWKFEESI